MNTQEAAALLAVAAAFDNRKPDPDAAMAWAAALSRLEFNSCRDAVVAHYRESREWIMPADVFRHVNVIAAKRMAPFGTLTPPAHLQGDVDEERKWILWARDEIVSGRATRPGDIGLEDASDYPVRDLREIGIFPDREPHRLANPELVAATVAKIRAESTAAADHQHAETEPTEEPADA